jgi:pimeloyl-ACP methyl ester carboxylesterase
VPAWSAWLCRPGLKVNWCNTYNSTTVIRADGSSTIEKLVETKPAIDCFYVYPTVSQEPTGNADLRIQTAEKAAIFAQAARFSQVCRVFAPVYRQTTGNPGGSSQIAYASVLAAWRDYLAHRNHGRGVVLIGHSQGSSMLEDLLEQQGASVRKVLVSALILGGDVEVGSDERFAGFPACRAPSQTGCVIGWSTWNRTPPADAWDEYAGSGKHVLCVNPGSLGSVSGVAAITPVFAWVVPEGLVPGPIRPEPKTFWISFPDLYRARCVRQGDRSWLLVTRIHHPGDPRPTVQPILTSAAGLHAADVNIALGNLLAIVQSETKAYAARARP